MAKTPRPDNQKSDPSGDALDLGLETLLEKLKGESEAPVISSSPPERIPEQKSDIASIQSLWSQDRIEEVVVRTENQETVLDKLWWVRAQVKKEDLPIAILHPIFSEVLDDDSLPLGDALEIETALELFEKLLRNKEYEVVINISKKVLQTLEGEEKRSFADRLHALFREVSFAGRELSPLEMKESLAVHDFIKILGNERKTEGSFESEDQKKIGLSAFDFSSRVIIPPKKDFRDDRTWILALLLLSVIFGSGWYIWHWYTSPAGEFADGGNEEALPKMELRDFAERREVSNLDALMYDVTQIEEKREAVAQSNAAEAKAAPIQTQLPPPVRSQQVALDMNGPYEPKKVAQILDRKNVSSYEREPEKQTEPEFPSDRRRPPPLPPGGIGKGVRYEIMINTSVMERPSFSAPEVEELYVGDRVRVEERMGRWLKVRSRSGKPGYIMAQDAQKLFD